MVASTLTGACTFKDFLNGLVFRQEGFTTNGSPWFKAVGAEQYIYYDLDCNGGSNGVARWILDADRPNPGLTQDLDQDFACNYHARLDSDNVQRFPLTASWSMFCGVAWTSTVLTFAQQGNASSYPLTTTIPLSQAQGFTVAGKFCPEKDYINDLVFLKLGTTMGGSPYYKATTLNQYIYFDRNCSGRSNVAARWVFDVDQPSRMLPYDLDNDGNCNYLARVWSNTSSAPPQAAMWRVFCDSAWQDTWVIVSPLTTSATTILTIVVNAAPGLRSQLLTSLFIPLLLAAYSLFR